MFNIFKSIYSNMKLRVQKSNFLQGIILISSSSILAQIVNFGFSPIITRIYSPEEYGIMSLFISTIGILSISSSLKYELALPMIKDEKEASSLVKLSIIILSVFTMLVGLIIHYFDTSFFSFFNAEGLIEYKILITIAIFMYGLKEIFVQLFFRERNYGLIAKYRLSDAIIGNISKISLVNIEGNGLIIGQIIKDTFSVFPYSYLIIKRKMISRHTNFNSIVETAVKYKDYPFFQAPSSFISIYKNQLPVFSLAYYSDGAVGLFGLANTIVKIPVTLFGYSIRNVFFAEAAKYGRDEPQKLKRLTLNTFKKLFMVGLVPFLLLFILSPYVFRYIFGIQWENSSIYTRILIPSIFADFIFSPVNRLYEIIGYQQIRLIIDIIGFLMVLISFLFARSISDSPYLGVALYSFVMTVYCASIYFVLIFLLNKIIKDEKM